MLSLIKNILEKQFSKESIYLQDITKSCKVNKILACKAISNPDTLYYNEAMIAYDRQYFKIAMNKKINNQIINKNLSVIK